MRDAFCVAVISIILAADKVGGIFLFALSHYSASARILGKVRLNLG